MMTLSTEEVNELMERDDIAVYDSLYAHLAYESRCDETPVDTLVRLYYLSGFDVAA
jgi:hypothetical protein